MARVVSVNGNKVLEINADVFIVPNSFMRATENVIYGKRYAELMNKILSASEHVTEDDPKMMQVWTTATEDLNCENLVDHIGHYWDENGKKQPIGNFPSYLPASMFVDAKEGDIVTIVYPEGTTVFNKDFKVIMHLTCKQKGYRYERFGTFEQVFAQLFRRFAA